MFGLTAVEVGTLAVGALGAGAAIYGANKQADASSAANTANQQNVQTANNESWTNYLASRGLNPGGTVAYGTIPTNAAPINTKLPLWATVNVPNNLASPGGSSGASSPALASAISSGGGMGASPVAGYAPRGQMPVGGYQGTPATTTPGF
jgi:hypothetical protein